MKICAAFLGACPYPVPQGSQVFLRDHARAFVEAGHEAHLITYGYGVGEMPGEDGVVHHRGPVPWGRRKTAAGPSLEKPMLDAALVGTVRRVVRGEGIQVIFAHNYEALVVGLAARVCPVIYHAHNTLEDELPHYFRGGALESGFGSGLIRGVGRWCDRNFPRRAHAVAVPHARLREHLVAECGCDAGRVHVVPPPVWVDAFRYVTVGESLPSVDYAGNLDAYQNLPLLQESVRLVREDMRGAVWRIGTAQAAGVPVGAEHVPVCNFAELREFLAADSIFAVPRVSWSGFPVKLLNAMAAGKAIVACASSGHALRDGVDGIVVPDNEPAVFAAALLQLMRDPALRSRLGAAARVRAAEHHDPAKTGEALAGIAREVMGTTSRAS